MSPTVSAASVANNSPNDSGKNVAKNPSMIDRAPSSTSELVMTSNTIVASKTNPDDRNDPSNEEDAIAQSRTLTPAPTESFQIVSFENGNFFGQKKICYFFFC